MFHSIIQNTWTKFWKYTAIYVMAKLTVTYESFGRACRSVYNDTTFMLMVCNAMIIFITVQPIFIHAYCYVSNTLSMGQCILQTMPYDIANVVHYNLAFLWLNIFFLISSWEFFMTSYMFDAKLLKVPYFVLIIYTDSYWIFTQCAAVKSSVQT